MKMNLVIEEGFRGLKRTIIGARETGEGLSAPRIKFRETLKK